MAVVTITYMGPVLGTGLSPRDFVGVRGTDTIVRYGVYSASVVTPMTIRSLREWVEARWNVPATADPYVRDPDNEWFPARLARENDVIGCGLVVEFHLHGGRPPRPPRPSRLSHRWRRR